MYLKGLNWGPCGRKAKILPTQLSAALFDICPKHFQYPVMIFVVKFNHPNAIIKNKKLCEIAVTFCLFFNKYATLNF